MLNSIVKSAIIKIVDHEVTKSAKFVGDRHCHNDLHQLMYVIRGASIIKIDKTTFNVGVGNLLFIKQGQWHQSYSIEEQDKGIEFLIVKFSLKNRKIRIPKVFSVVSRFEFVDMFGKFLNEFYMKRNCRDESLRFYLAQLFLIGYRDFNIKKNKKHISKNTFIGKLNIEKGINKAIDFIRNNYCNKIKLKDIALEINVSESSLSHNFKIFTGVSPIEYLINYRFVQSLVMMRDGSCKLSAIAEKIGFPNVYYFSRLFKKKYGLSPKKYFNTVFAR